MESVFIKTEQKKREEKFRKRECFEMKGLDFITSLII